MKYTNCKYCGSKLDIEVEDIVVCDNHTNGVAYDNGREIITISSVRNRFYYIINIHKIIMELIIIDRSKIDDVHISWDIKPIILPIDNSLTPENSEEKIKTYLSFQ
jgi:hypothetical protein